MIIDINQCERKISTFQDVSKYVTAFPSSLVIYIYIYSYMKSSIVRNMQVIILQAKNLIYKK